MSVHTAEPLDVGGLTIGVIGGTGDQGRGLARRFSLAGHKVIIGSRNGERAQAAAMAVGVLGAENTAAAEQADIVVVTVPWDGHHATLTSLREELAGKIVVDCVNPMGFDRRGAYALSVPEGSAAEQAAGLLPGSRVVAAFHHVSASVLLDPDVPRVELDVLVLGDDRGATDVIQALAERIDGVRGVYGGRLRNAHQVEALTANLISINRRYHTHAGIRVTNL